MLAEDGVVVDAHDVVFVVLVLLLQVAKEAQLDASLVLEALLVADHLDGHHHLRFVVEALQGLPETARAELVDHFEAVSQVVFDDYLVVASLVVETEVVAQKGRRLDLGRFETEEVTVRVVLDLYLFVVRQSLILVELQGLAARHRELHLVDSDCRAGLLRV